MPRLHTATKAKRIPREKRPNLALVATPPPERCLALQGQGHPECAEFYLAIEAMEAVTQVLRCAVERAGRINETIGEIQKSWSYRPDEKVWIWKVRAMIPTSITATAVELAKHLAGRNQFVEPICLMPMGNYTVH